MSNPIMKGLLNAKPYEPVETYKVKIMAIVTKSIVVTSIDRNSAIQKAHEMFSTYQEDPNEIYKQNAVYVRKHQKRK